MARTIPLTRGLVAIVDEDDYPAVSQHRWCASPSRPGLYYAMRKDRNKRTVYMHRLLCQTAVGGTVDHKNANTLDNRRENLRPATESEQQKNARRRSRRRPFKGVWAYKTKWRAGIKSATHQYFLGTFDSAIEAAEAYDIAAINLFRMFARTNFPLSRYEGEI